MFTIYGALLTIVGLTLPNRMLFPWLLPAGMVVSLLVMVIWLVYASYLDYRHDPHPEPVRL